MVVYISQAIDITQGHQTLHRRKLIRVTPPHRLPSTVCMRAQRMRVTNNRMARMAGSRSFLRNPGRECMAEVQVAHRAESESAMVARVAKQHQPTKQSHSPSWSP